MPLIFNEDFALKTKLTGMQVVQGANSIPVKAWFGLPQAELRDLTFPAIILEHTSIARAPEREHRGPVFLDYAPEGSPTWWAANAATYDPKLSPYKMEFPIPLNIDYEVTVLAREKTHLMQVVATLTASDRLPPRFGGMLIPQDGTIRPVDVIGGPEIEAERDPDGKRIFRAKYAVRVPAEVIPADYPAIFRVQTVDLALSQFNLTLFR